MGAVNPIHYSLRVTTCAVIVKHIKGIGQYNMLLYRLLSSHISFPVYYLYVELSVISA